jgi:hypothetical protein
MQTGEMAAMVDQTMIASDNRPASEGKPAKTLAVAKFCGSRPPLHACAELTPHPAGGEADAGVATTAANSPAC